MQPEQPNTPSADVQASDVAAEPRSDEPAEKSSGSWWSRMFNRNHDDTETNAASGDGQPAAPPASKPLSLTPEELERRIQSETDRREARRAQDAKIARRRELRDKDPWAYAEEERKDEQLGESNGQLSNLVVGIGTHHDRATIDPVVEALPEEERKRIFALEGAGAGLDGRKLLVKESLKALEKHWRAEGARDAETKLRRNTAFRKQVFSEFRGSQVEPDLLPGRASPTADETVSALLRTHYGLGN